MGNRWPNVRFFNLRTAPRNSDFKHLGLAGGIPLPMSSVVHPPTSGPNVSSRAGNHTLRRRRIVRYTREAAREAEEDPTTVHPARTFYSKSVLSTPRCVVCVVKLECGVRHDLDTAGPQLVCVFSGAVAQLSVSFVIILNVTLCEAKRRQV